MNEPKTLIELRKRRIKSGKNFRIYGSIFFWLVNIIVMIIDDVEVFPLVLILVIIWFVMISLMTIRIFNEEMKLSRLLDNEKNNDID